ncbi:hypothetical protein [Microbulbifer sp.]|uniref:hypothetical protein n=1 Tax=Microbulbifer sp. TaxID=1908541 RepID=UPI002586F6F2|nr:hypothetical protein [Microbulbifer sp.]
MPSTLHMLVKRVQVDVGDQWADHASLGATALGGLTLVSDHDAALQELLEQRQDAAVGDLAPDEQLSFGDGLVAKFSVPLHTACTPPNQVRLRYVLLASYGLLPAGAPETQPLASDALASRIVFPSVGVTSPSFSDRVCRLRRANKKAALKSAAKVTV